MTSLWLLFVVVILTTNTGIAAAPKEIKNPAENFDPLELSRDTISAPVRMAQAAKQADQRRVDSLQGLKQRPLSLVAGARGDSSSYQSYKVQLSTSETYGESRQALRVAEEIFDQPVVLDYDVPYFKLRVGDFKTRQDADAYALKAKAAGYPNAWVVVVNTAVRQAPSLYDRTTEDVVDSAKSSQPSDSQ